MKRILALLLLACMLLATPARAEDTTSTTKAQSAADAWLSVTDSADYAQSWEKTAGLFQSAVTQSKWKADLEKVRLPLGKVKSRKLESADLTRVLPNAPDGEYVVMQYRSQFERHSNIVETVTSMREADGSWKIVGYYIKRAQ